MKDFGDGVVLLLRDSAGFRAFQVWTRLVLTSLPDVRLQRAIVAEAKVARALLAAIPPGERAEIRVVSPEQEMESRFNRESVAIGVITSGEITYWQAGGPTDAGWDALELAARGGEGTPAP